MRWSEYNNLFKSEKHGWLLYNSFTNAFAEIDPDTQKKLEKIQKNPDSYKFESEDDTKLLAALKEGKIVVENDFDEVAFLKIQQSRMKYNTNTLMLTIAPTSDCNFRCPYCFEGENKKYMSDETENNLIEFIKRHKDAKTVSIAWFGGEPLMAFERIKSFTKKALALGKDYNATMVTNAYLLTEDVIKELDNVKINRIQITIDGPEEIHNKRRPHKTEKNSFQTIIKNLDMLTASNWTGSVSVRINIDASNRDSYKEIHKFLTERYKGKRVSPYPAYVDNFAGTCAADVKGCMDKTDIVNFEVDQYKNTGTIMASFYPNQQSGLCTATAMNSYLIGPDGEQYKCWNDLGKEALEVGNVKETSITEKQSAVLTQYLGIDAFESESCKNCFYLPVCLGGCPYQRKRNKYNGEKHDTCVKFKGNLKKFLEIHYEIRKKQGRI